MFLMGWKMVCRERGHFYLPGIKSHIMTNKLPSPQLFLYPRLPEVLKDREGRERKRGREGRREKGRIDLMF